MRYRTFTTVFKQQLVAEVLSATSKPMEICRRHNIARPLLAKWIKKFANGEKDYHQDNQNIDLVYQKKIQQLEAMIGRLAMDNDLLKKALQETISRQSRKEILSQRTKEPSALLVGGAA